MYSQYMKSGSVLEAHAMCLAIYNFFLAVAVAAAVKTHGRIVECC